MDFGVVTSALLGATALLGFAWWMRRRVAEANPLPLRRAVATVFFGIVALCAVVFLQSWILRFAGISLVAAHGNEKIAALSMLLVVTPLEEASKALVIWPLYHSRRLSSGTLGATYAVLAAAGFAAAELVWLGVRSEQSYLLLLRGLLAVPAHLFFAGLWGYTLGGGRRDRFFLVTWLGATAVHGIYDHIVFGRGPAYLVIAIPMFATMAVGVFGLLRDGRPTSSFRRSSGYSLFEPPSVASVGQALKRNDRPLMVRWIVLGAFVNMGVTLVFLATAIYLGHRYGVDFELADEEGAEGMIPVALLGMSLLSAFPVSAYLIARASGASSVLEPAWASGLAIIVVLSLFSVTEPTALIIAVGIAPVSFLLACLGAWFGLSRR